VSSGAVTVVLFHRGSKSNSTLDSGGQTAGVCATKCLEDFSRAEDDEGGHSGIADISVVQKSLYTPVEAGRGIRRR
jgi:hypothetical protein